MLFAPNIMYIPNSFGEEIIRKNLHIKYRKTLQSLIKRNRFGMQLQPYQHVDWIQGTLYLVITFETYKKLK